MRTVCGLARAVQTLVARRPSAPVAAVRPLAGGRQPLLTDRIGEQRRGGAKLDQVDGTTCGSAVLVAVAGSAVLAVALEEDRELRATATRIFGQWQKSLIDNFLKAGVAADRAIVVEDAVSGVAAGAAGGFAYVLGVDRATPPASNAAALAQAGATAVVRDLAETLAPSSREGAPS